MKNWEVLKDKRIIDYIIGDLPVSDDIYGEYKMPRMSGPNICDFGNELGLEMDYWKNEKLSRWVYMQNILDHAIRNDKINILFKKLLDLKRFKDIGKMDKYKSANQIYWELVNGFLQKVNEELFFEKCHIEYNLETWQFILVDDEKDVKIISKSIDEINKDYIKKLKEQIDISIKNKDYESCITKSRTLIEEILIHGIEVKNDIITAKGNINKLYSKFKTLYNMHQNKDMDKRINNLLSGLEKIINSIAEMRDENSDSHGAGSKRYNIERHHAILFANSAITISEFLLSVINNNNKN